MLVLYRSMRFMMMLLTMLVKMLKMKPTGSTTRGGAVPLMPLDLPAVADEAAVDVVDHRTRPAICSALGNLGSMRAIPILLELLEFGTPGTSAAAQAALVRLTGRRDVAADSRLWIEELGLDDAR